MDGRISMANSELKAAQESANESGKLLEDANSAHGRSTKSLQKTEDEFKTADLYLKSHPADDRLTDILPSVESYLGIWNDKEKERVLHPSWSPDGSKLVYCKDSSRLEVFEGRGWHRGRRGLRQHIEENQKP